jgi:hypothetical protein
VVSVSFCYSVYVSPSGVYSMHYLECRVTIGIFIIYVDVLLSSLFVWLSLDQMHVPC